MALQVTHSGVGDPAIFLTDPGEGDSEGGEGARAGEKPNVNQSYRTSRSTPALSTTATDFWRRGPEGTRRGRGRGEGGMRRENFESRGQARQRTAQLEPSTELARSVDTEDLTGPRNKPQRWQRSANRLSHGVEDLGAIMVTFP
jgi:hypothetical protein